MVRERKPEEKERKIKHFDLTKITYIRSKK
jgi:hypothetical protein